MKRKAHQHFILATCVTSAFAAIIGMVSLGTEEWVSSAARHPDFNFQNSYVNYGLFSGTFDRNFLQSSYYQLSITCSSDGQACAMLCGGTTENREEQLRQLLQGIDITFDATCPRIQRNIKLADPPASLIRTSRATGNRTYIDFGIYASTVAFLVISIAVGVAAVGLSVWNTIGNPIYTVFNVDGIIGLNVAAAVCVTLTMILWGIQYNLTLTENVAILETITEDMDTLDPSLGYSYWINIISIFLYSSSILLIVLRKLFLSREPAATNMEMLKSDDRTIVLF